MFNAELDFLSKFLTFCVIVSLALLLFYAILPTKLRSGIDAIDLKPGHEGSLSKSGLTCLIYGITMVVFIAQKLSRGVSDADKLTEGRLEKEFRHRQQLTTDIHIYSLQMLFGIWCTLNFIIGLNRDRLKAIRIVAEGNAERVGDKKND